MENKINIAELLKDCPKGMELNCTMFDNVTLGSIMDGNCYPIQIQTPEGNMLLSKYGCMSLSTHSKCVIFPKGKTTWEGFQRPFKDGEIVAYDNNLREHLQIFIFKDNKENDTLSTCYLMLDGDELDLEEGMYYVTRLATEEEKEKLFQAIKDNGYHWNDETKTLEKLGKEKFDITTLKPFESMVLVRTTNEDIWRPAIYGFSVPNKYYIVGGIYWGQCIPYEGNEYLLGTTDDCDEFYKNW